MGFFSVAQWPSRSPNVCHNILITLKMHPNHEDTAAESLTKVLSRQRAILFERGLLSGKPKLGHSRATRAGNPHIPSEQLHKWDFFSPVYRVAGMWDMAQCHAANRWADFVCSQGTGRARVSDPHLCSIL